MIILGIDTSSDCLNIALGKDGGLISEVSLNIPRKHIANIIRVLDNVFEKSGLAINDIGLFVVVKGPGSFTGIRIAVTVVKGFAAALEKDVVSVTSLDVLAQNAFNTEGKYIYPVLDAVRGNVYSACYLKEKGKITNKEYTILANINSRTSLRDLNDLCDKGVFEKIGITGRGTQYILTRHKPDKHDINQTQRRQKGTLCALRGHKRDINGTYETDCKKL